MTTKATQYNRDKEIRRIAKEKGIPFWKFKKHIKALERQSK